LQDLFQGCQVLVDLSHHALATKLLMNLAHGGGLALVRGFAWERDGMAGLRLFTYRPGREWRELGDLLPARQLPGGHGGDPGLALIIAGLVLEEVKKLLLGEEVTPAMVSYARPILAGDRGAGRLPAGGGYPDGAPLRGGGSAENRLPGREVDPGEPCPQAGGQLPLAVVGAGALGNFVGLGLAAAGFSRLTCIDPDRVEITNLNRQLLFWDAVGEPKAEVLARRLRAWFGVAATAWTAYLDRDTDLGKFAGIFDCTDNHESRIVLSEKCRLGGLALVSGGTGVTAGQVVVYDAARGGPTPAEVLGLYDLVDPRQVEARRRQRASCRYQPEPAVIMTNQVVGGLMVDAWRRLRRGEAVPPLFYDARSERLL